LTSVTARVTPESQPRWELPVWGPVAPVPALDAPALSDSELDAIVSRLLADQTPPPSYRELAARFRAAGHSAAEMRLRTSWKRLTTPATG
jgi:hypothetical protein